jgi:DNA modification methylase
MTEQQVFSGFEDLVKPDVKAKLEAKFIIPPFSVFDTRQGYWQDRKRLWLSLGVKSEMGRSGNLTYTGKVADIHAYDGQSKNQEEVKTDHYSEAGRDPNLIFKAKEVTSQNLNFYREKEKAKEDDNEEDFYKSVIAERGGGTSIFDPVLCELCYKWFCPIGGNILDPFSGGSVRGIVAHILGYKYTGIDLSQEQIEANRQQAQEIIPDNKPTWIVGNSIDVHQLIRQNNGSWMDFDAVFSCPPYFDLEQYSEKDKDLSNMTWSDFKDDYSDIISKSCRMLKQNRFACFVVSEVRSKKTGHYRGFVPFTIAAFKRAGMQYYNEIILVNQVGSMPIRIKKMFGDYRKIGRVHQNVLVFYKGNVDEIPKNFNHIETDINFT